jgi:uncharacterized protein
MVMLEYESLRFEDGEKIRVTFQNIYNFYLNKEEVSELGRFKVHPKGLEFSSGKKEANLRQKFEFLLTRGFEDLRCSLNGKPVLYVHSNSGIPLIGSNEFGIIDRGTNTIEVKPLSSCNIDCIFCSVDHTKRTSDVYVECDYLVDELRKVISIKKGRVNIHIGSQGDPSLYGDLVRLVKEIRDIKEVAAISMVSNGILLSKTLADRLIDAGMTHFHISLHSLDPQKAEKLANAKYPVKKVMESCEYIAKKAHLLLVPVWVPGINDNDIEDVIKFAKDIGATLGIQNFLEYQLGKKPVNPLPMKLFYKKLGDLEKKLDVNLTKLDTTLEFHEDTRLEKPFRKGDVVQAEILGISRLPHSVIAAAKGRVITIMGTDRKKGSVKVRLTRDKDNIFIGSIA